MNVKKIKNADTITHTWCGQDVLAGQYYTLLDFENEEFSTNKKLITDIANGIAVVSNGNVDITNISSAIDYLKDTRIKHIDGRDSIQTSARPIGTRTYFTGRGDDRTTPTDVGGGNHMELIHTIGDPLTQDVYIDFNCENNKTYLNGARINYTNAQYSCVSASIVPEVTASNASTGTNFNVYGGYLIIPATGTGTLDVQTVDMKLVYIPLDYKGNREPAFWNADWNSTTNQYDNVTPAPLGDGAYNMFSVEVPLNNFVNDIALLGTSTIDLFTEEGHEIGGGMRLKVRGHIDTGVTDHDWEMSFYLKMFRAKSV